jgi:hypothetical protein
MPSDPNSPPPQCWPVRPGVNGRSAAPATARRIPSCARGVEKPRPLAARAAKFLGGRKDPRDAERLCVNHLVTTDRNKSSRARATSKGSQHIAPRPRDMRNGSGNAGRTQSTTYANSRPSCVHAGNFRALQRVDRPVERYGTGNWNYEEFTQE